jgi:hypothetical protein
MYPFPFVPDMGNADPLQSKLYLGSVHVTIEARDALDKPLFGVLVTEDFCWRMTLRDWRARRPSMRHRDERAAWRAERGRIEQERERIEQLAADLGLAVGRG